MAVRKIIKINEELCTGCGECIPNCPEGALQIIDGKARMISDLFCDGLGACIGHCPEGAITIIEREAEEYDERRVMENVVKQGPNVIKAHLEHMKEHGQSEYLAMAIDYLRENDFEVPAEFDDAGGDAEADEEPECVEGPLPCGCPGSLSQELSVIKLDEGMGVPKPTSQLSNWPVQIHLVNVQAAYLKEASLLIAADCTAFACASLHQDFIKGRVTMMGCPKLDDAQFYAEKLGQIIKMNDIRDITVLYMEVPCCAGMVRLVQEAVAASGLDVPVRKYMVKINGEVVETG